MLGPSVASATAQFYPIGNTPAINLTRAIPQNIDSSILLLGCGDVRNILFTAYMQDTSPRNIVLFSFLIDDARAPDDSLWNIYYHLYLDESDIEVLAAQVKKLAEASQSLQSWKLSRYGKLLPFCDEATFDDVRAVWAKYIAAATNSGSQHSAALKKQLQRSADNRSQRFNIKPGESVPIATGMRSAAPISMASRAEVTEAYNHYWKYGTTGLSRPSTPNPLIAASLSENTVLHYGTDPILGFHLATAFASLAEASPLRPESDGETFKVVAAAKVQFKAWAKACSELFNANRLVVRSAAADAFAFTQTLQHWAQWPRIRRPGAVSDDASAGWYRRQLDSRVLVLDLDSTMSRAFDAIDTSNLADHFGTLNLLTTCLPLLALQPWATLSTETLLKGSGSSDQEILDKLLYGHAPSISLILGISPVEYWTNATAVSKVDETIIGLTNPSEVDAGQIQSRVSWKHTGSLSGSHAHIPIRMEPRELAAVIFQMYMKMFEHENPMAMLSASKSAGSRSVLTSGYSHFHRGSLVAIMKFLGTSLLVRDIEGVCIVLDGMISADQTIAFSGNQTQEMASLFHIHNLWSADWLSQIRRNPSNGSFNAWGSIPEVVAITLVVPRAKVDRLYKSSPQAMLAAPTFLGSLRSSPTAGNQWHNMFADVHLAFGTVTTSGLATEADFAVQVKADEAGWSGTAPLIASFYVPAAALQVESKSALVGLDVQTTLQGIAVFRSVLGTDMNVFQARLDDVNRVFVSKFLPGQRRYPAYSAAGNNLNAAYSAPISLGQSSFTAQYAGSGRITGIVGRLSVLPNEALALLKEMAPVAVRQTSPFALDFVIGTDSAKLPIIFPVPVDSRSVKTRIARKSGYVEAIVPFANPASMPMLSDFVYPSVTVTNDESEWVSPVALNAPHLSLNRLPILDISDKASLSWLTSLTSAQFSLAEKNLRDAADKESGMSSSARLNFKESLFTMFMLASGLQGGQTGLFSINHPDRGGIHMLIFVSAIRLDGASASVILDAAVIPLTIPLVTSGKIENFLLLLRTLEICSIDVNDEELILWKKALPALAERARTWSHKKSCEYNKARKVPLSIEPSEAVLCSCGAGHLPDGFIGVPEWETASKYATRIAISPTFAVSFVEDVFDFKGFQSIQDSVGGAAKERCSSCGATEAKGTGGPLKKCSRCQTAKYCGAECQKKDWRTHRGECAPGLQ
ncbi:hypothetical protein ACHAQA_006348 [Verticillium albo-atrum]